MLAFCANEVIEKAIPEAEAPIDDERVEICDLVLLAREQSLRLLLIGSVIPAVCCTIHSNKPRSLPPSVRRIARAWLSVATSASEFLEVVLDTGWVLPMDHEPDVRHVDSHAECVCADHSMQWGRPVGR